MLVQKCRLVGLLCFLVLVGAYLPANLHSVKADNGQMVRVGVVPEAETITLGSEQAFTITDKTTNEVLVSGENESVEVALESTGTITTAYRLQVAWTTNDAYVDDWLTRAEIGGYEAYIEPYQNGSRLFIGKFSTDASWASRNEFRDEVIKNGLANTDSFWKLITTTTGVSTMKIRHQKQVFTTENPVTITSQAGFIEINGHKYRGVGEVAYNSKGTLAGINELPLEQYLYGVVPRELPPVPYGEMEAQKSQAVAARTYTLANLGKRNKDGYDLLPTTADQVYSGYEVEHPVSTEAIQKTSGVVAVHNGQLITAVYHSTSGGFTANNDDIWSSNPIDYLRGMPDAERGNSVERVPTLEVFKNHANPTSLRATKEGDYESDWSKYHRWEFQWSNEEISKVLSVYFEKDVGEVYEINITKRSDSGRVLEIEYVTEKGTYYEQKDRVRWSLKYINANGGMSVLRSTLFFVEPIKTKHGETRFQVYGGGWGHGVGLSQTGAVGMATKGDTYEEILQHYYQGIELEHYK